MPSTAPFAYDDRIILRSGTFGAKYIHYPLKNIGTIQVAQGMFDNKGKDGSGTLTITVMDFHAGKQAKACVIAHLCDVFTACRILCSLTEGANEAVRIRQV